MKIHLCDQGRTYPYCHPKLTGRAIKVTYRLEDATCKTCINLATIGRR